MTSGLALLLDAENAKGAGFPGLGCTFRRWFDLLSFGNDGTLINFTSCDSTIGWNGDGTTSISGTAGPYRITFNGVNYVSTTYLQNAVTAYSVEAWISTASGANQIIVNNRGSGAGMSLTLYLVSGSVYFALDSNGILLGGNSTATVDDGNWHHVVGTWSAPSGTIVAPSQFKIYIDGVESTNAYSVAAGATSPLTGLGGTVVGYSPVWGNNFNGHMAKVAIYTDELTPAQVVQNCNALKSRFAGASCN